MADNASKHLHEWILANPDFQSGDYENAIRHGLKEQDQKLLKDFSKGKNDAAISGSTLALAIVDSTAGEILVANVGDSHVVMGEWVGKGDGARLEPVSSTGDYCGPSGTAMANICFAARNA